MTIDIAEKWLKNIKEKYIHGGDDDYDEKRKQAIDKAIASLKAWEEVRQEINDLFSKPAYYMPNYDAYKMFLEIIDRHLQERSVE